jgi:hypothetical protein
VTFVVLYDANVLYPDLLRDLVVRIAIKGIVRARWSERILDEMLGALERERPDLDVGRRVGVSLAYASCLPPNSRRPRLRPPHARASAVYRALLLSILARAESQAYGVAAKYWQRLAELASRRESLAPLVEHTAFVSGLREQHAR